VVCCMRRSSNAMKPNHPFDSEIEPDVKIVIEDGQARVSGVGSIATTDDFRERLASFDVDDLAELLVRMRADTDKAGPGEC
jgi:hypothetical protein